MGRDNRRYGDCDSDNETRRIDRNNSRYRESSDEETQRVEADSDYSRNRDEDSFKKPFTYSRTRDDNEDSRKKPYSFGKKNKLSEIEDSSGEDMIDYPLKKTPFSKSNEHMNRLSGTLEEKSPFPARRRSFDLGKDEDRVKGSNPFRKESPRSVIIVSKLLSQTFKKKLKIKAYLYNNQKREKE